jgi:hypothetical protein
MPGKGSGDGEDGPLIEAMGPSFTACHTAGEWIRAGQIYPDFLGLTKSAAVSDIDLATYCSATVAISHAPVCVDAKNRGIDVSVSK